MLMTVIEVRDEQTSLSPRQRWSHYFVFIYLIISIIVGINLRDAALNATVLYVNNTAGIRAFYPQNWLIDTSGDYVFRVRDMTEVGYKTTIQVAVLPVTVNTSARSLLDTLTLRRAPTLDGYRVLSRQSYPLPNEREATAMRYVYVENEANPFLDSVPVVVEGIDVLTIQGGQAVVFTFLSDSNTFDASLPIFERFLSDVEF